MRQHKRLARAEPAAQFAPQALLPAPGGPVRQAPIIMWPGSSRAVATRLDGPASSRDRRSGARSAAKSSSARRSASAHDRQRALRGCAGQAAPTGLPAGACGSVGRMLAQCSCNVVDRVACTEHWVVVHLHRQAQRLELLNSQHANSRALLPRWPLPPGGSRPSSRRRGRAPSRATHVRHAGRMTFFYERLLDHVTWRSGNLTCHRSRTLLHRPKKERPSYPPTQQSGFRRKGLKRWIHGRLLLGFGFPRLCCGFRGLWRNVRRLGLSYPYEMM